MLFFLLMLYPNVVMRFFYSWKLRDTANMPSPDGKSAEEEFTPLLLCFDLKVTHVNSTHNPMARASHMPCRFQRGLKNEEWQMNI